MHPEFLKLRIARELYSDCFIGIYSNGVTLKSYEENDAFWNFTRTEGIVWAITYYDSSPQYFESLFERHGCLNNLAVIQAEETFCNLSIIHKTSLLHGKNMKNADGKEVR